MAACEKKNGCCPIPGVSIWIEKKIPVGGGLGGGSSNAATVLMTLNEYLGEAFSKAELQRLGLLLGADVPFFIFGAPALATGVGEILEPVPDLPGYHVVLCDPGVTSSTAAVFKNLKFKLTTNGKYNISTGLNMLPTGQGDDPRKRWHNDLEASAVQLYPGIESTRKEMALLLQRRVYMSGSGSSLFALFSDPGRAQQGYDQLKREWESSLKQVLLARIRR
jgi:4-diphosphocytidyl-2-C-methyl-D-erythritol kinase